MNIDITELGATIDLSDDEKEQLRAFVAKPGIAAQRDFKSELGLSNGAASRIVIYWTKSGLDLHRPQQLSSGNAHHAA
jgi:uncharacterized membrane protein